MSRAQLMELSLEDSIVTELQDLGWIYEDNIPGQPVNPGWSPSMALHIDDALDWIKTQFPDDYKKAVEQKATDLQIRQAELKLLQRMANELDTTPTVNQRTKAVQAGLLGTLRSGFSFAQIGRPSATIDKMVAFYPYNKNITTAIDRAKQNKLRVMRQVRFDTTSTETIDLVLLVNGIPVITMELKTDFTQGIEQAKDQYAFDRRPNKNRPLLAPGRCLVHFAVSTSEVWMCTKLESDLEKRPTFLPFNQGTEEGKGGNPVNPDGYKTDYLWKWVLEPQRFLRILRDYALWEPSRKGREGSLIFPRFHQLRATEKVISDVKDNGVGSRRLLQHSAGSGKTKTIAWIAHQANKLVDDDGESVFDSVIVITDRKALDANVIADLRLLQASEGVIVNIDAKNYASKSQQLNKVLNQGGRILSCTIQTFPALAKTIERSPKLRNRNWCLIIDEAHSSQHGDAQRQVLTTLADAEVEPTEDMSTDEALQLVDSAVAKAHNVSIIALTATPKDKTLAVYGQEFEDADTPVEEPILDGVVDMYDPALVMVNNQKKLFGAFDLYPMSQAIDEGFILDVLKNYTSMNLFAEIEDSLGREEAVVLGEAVSDLVDFVRSDEKTIEVKAKVVLRHFHRNVKKLLGGTAKAMVITSSRHDAYQWWKAMNEILESDMHPEYKGMKTLAAFSGSLDMNPEGKDEPALVFTESKLNEGAPSKDTAEAFDMDDSYKFLIVANKYQTGFDQPRLCAMYVDKGLSGVNAVQTLSRLNRRHGNNKQTMIVDFINEPEKILEAFKKYYKGATLESDQDPNKLYKLAREIDKEPYYTQEDIDNIAHAYLENLGGEEVASKADKVVERWTNKLSLARAGAENPEEDETVKEILNFKANLNKYVHAWEFMSQFIDFQDVSLHKRAIAASVIYSLLNAQSPSKKRKNYRDGIELVSVMVDAKDEFEEADLKLDHESSKNPADPMSDIPWDAKVGGGKAPDKDAFDKAVEEVNDIFSAAGIEIDSDIQEDMFLEVYRRVADDDRTENVVKGNTVEEIMNSRNFENIILEHLLSTISQKKEYVELITGSHDAINIFKQAMAAVAVNGFKNTEVAER